MATPVYHGRSSGGAGLSALGFFAQVLNARSKLVTSSLSGRLVGLGGA